MEDVVTNNRNSVDYSHYGSQGPHFQLNKFISQTRLQTVN